MEYEAGNRLLDLKIALFRQLAKRYLQNANDVSQKLQGACSHKKTS
jgi:hypothetical protein